MTEWLIGVDEAGRGPLAGPVSVGVVAVPLGFDVAAEFPGITDSKKLSRQKRELLFMAAERRFRQGDLQFDVRFSDHSYIDEHGISKAVEVAAHSGIRALSAPSHATVLLDGLLRAPRRYEQMTITGGDLRVPVISLASVLAKVTRDRLMEELSRHYPEWGFEQHKGYGTEGHRRAIKRHGLSAIHRRSFCGV